MQKNITSSIGIFNPRVLLAFILCAAGTLLAIVSLAATHSNRDDAPPAANLLSTSGSNGNRLRPEERFPGLPLALGAADWAIVSSPNTSFTENNILYSVTCLSASDCWAVGFYYGSDLPFQTLIERWDGTSWAIVTSPNTSATDYNVLTGVVCVSALECWAVGYRYNINDLIPQTLIERWDGTSWTIVTSPNTNPTQKNVLAGVTCPSASECWAVGYYDTDVGNDQTLTERWDGTSWAIVTSPNTSATDYDQLTGVTCPSASECWAVGYYFDANLSLSQTLIERWDGTSWTIVTSPNTSATDYNFLAGVTCASVSDCWAVGNYQDADTSIPQTLIERWDGTSWAIVTSPNTSATDYNYLQGVTCTSPSDCWAVGNYNTDSFIPKTLIERWDGASWVIVRSPNASTQSNYLQAVTCVSDSDCWAVGDYYLQSASNIAQTLVLRYTPRVTARPRPTPHPRPTPPQ